MFLRVRHFHNLLDRIDGAERIGNVGDTHQTRSIVDEFLKFIHDQLAAIVDGPDTQAAAFFLAEHLPGDNVRVMFHRGNQDFVPGGDVLAPISLRDQIDAFGRAAHIDNFARVRPRSGTFAA